MKDIVFGMVVGGMLGILLYKNNECTKKLFDQGEKIIVEEIEKMEKANNPVKTKKNNY